MEIEYSSEAVTAARSLQTYTVRCVLVDRGVIDNYLLLVYVRCVLSEPIPPRANVAQRPWLQSGCIDFDVSPPAIELTCHHPDL
jgi:hypothetical protein